MTLADDDLPGFWHEADQASLRGQAHTLQLTRLRLGGLLLAAVGGVLSWTVGSVDVAAAVVAFGFLVALVSEIVTWVAQPERDWYSGRALAESAKTLAWRYAVGADPFPAEMSTDAARSLLTERLAEVSKEARDRVPVGAFHAVVTPAMDRLRARNFDERKTAYLEGRTRDQQRWYVSKANNNRNAATRWRIILITGEAVALVLAAARIFGAWRVDLAGLCAAVIASGFAWVAVKQFTTLASAYSTTATELALQATRLETVGQRDWALAVADAEEAISREHTLWLASRTGRGSL